MEFARIQQTPGGPRREWLSRLGRLGLGSLLAWSAGCSHRDALERTEPGITRIAAPQAPAFFRSPAVALLTNAAGFTAQVAVQAQGLTDQEAGSSGLLFARGSKLLFAPAGDGSAVKRGRLGGFSYLWEASEGRGYLLCEALQAYAPVSARTRVTNVATRVVQAAAERISGHPCDLAEATFLTDDGGTSVYQCRRATDLGGLSLQVQSQPGTSTLALTLSKVRAEVPPAELFEIPAGFAKYGSPEALVDELAARQHNLRRVNPELERYLREHQSQ